MPFSITTLSGTYPNITVTEKRNLLCLSFYLDVGGGWIGLDW
jgi:hypothetical protein